MKTHLPISFVVSTLTVLGTLAALRWTARSPDPLRSPAPAQSAQPAKAPAPSPKRAAAIVELPQLRIRGRTPPARRAAPHESKTAELVPCSPWRAIGPVYSAPAGTTPRERRVQLLCPKR